MKALIIRNINILFSKQNAIFFLIIICNIITGFAVRKVGADFTFYTLSGLFVTLRYPSFLILGNYLLVWSYFLFLAMLIFYYDEERNEEFLLFRISQTKYLISKLFSIILVDSIVTLLFEMISLFFGVYDFYFLTEMFFFLVGLHFLFQLIFLSFSLFIKSKSVMFFLLFLLIIVFIVESFNKTILEVFLYLKYHWFILIVFIFLFWIIFLYLAKWRRKKM